MKQIKISGSYKKKEKNVIMRIGIAFAVLLLLLVLMFISSILNSEESEEEYVPIDYDGNDTEVIEDATINIPDFPFDFPFGDWWVWVVMIYMVYFFFMKGRRSWI